MKIGIIGAMDIEVDELISSMKSIEKQEISGIDYYAGSLEGRDVVVAKCGVGKVNAAICAQTMILKYSPFMIINIGVAGSLDSKLKIADLVISDFVVQHDYDITAFGYEAGYISGLNLVKIPCDQELIHKLESAAKLLEDTNVFVGTVASGDQFVSNKQKKDSIVNNFKALCTEMEGASIGHTCYINKVKFCIVRSISDNADGSAHMDFPQFSLLAANKSSALIKNFLQNL